MNNDDSYPSGLVFDAQAVKSVLNAADLSLAEPSVVSHFQSQLNRIASEYYWNLFTPPSRTQGGPSFGAVIDASVTPSWLNNRLIAIKRAAKRVRAANSRYPLSVRVAKLLDRLGYGIDGKPKRYSGTEEPGHGDSERSAVWLCLVRAVLALTRPHQGYRPTISERPWASQRLQAAINSLAAFLHTPEETSAAALEAASALQSWAEWSSVRLKPLINSDPTRHQGHLTLDAAILELAALYRETFGREPSLSHRIGSDKQIIPNSWELFLHTILQRILPPEPTPSITALESRWRRLVYPDRKNRI